MTPGLPVLMAYIVYTNAALMAMNQRSFYSGKAVCKASRIKKIYQINLNRSVTNSQYCTTTEKQSNNSTKEKPFRILYKFQAHLSQSTSMLYNYIITVSQQDAKTLTSSVMQLCANLCTWPRHAQKRARPGKHSRGPRRRRRNGPAHTARPKWCCSLGLTLKAGMLSNSQKGEKERRGIEEREGRRRRGRMRAKRVCASI